jgi:DNA polymerase III delta prime subunit
MSVVDVVGNRKAKESVLEWVKSGKKPLLLAGPVGVGKTSLAWAACRAKGWEVVEPQTAPGEMLQIVTSVLTRKGERNVALIFDEVDSWHGHERSELVKLVKQQLKNLVPIIFICDEVDKGMEGVRGLCQLVRMYRGDGSDEVAAIAQRLHRLTSHTWPPSVVQHIAKVSCGDLRKAVNLLESSAATGGRRGAGEPGASDVFVDSLFDATECLLSQYPRALPTVDREAVFHQHELMLHMMHENLPLRHMTSVLELTEWFSDMNVLDAHPSHQLHDYPGALTSHLLGTLPPVRMRQQRLQFPAYLGAMSKRKSMRATLLQNRMSYDDWSLLAPGAARSPEIFSWMATQYNYAADDFRDALKAHRPMQGLLGGGAV